MWRAGKYKCCYHKNCYGQEKYVCCYRKNCDGPNLLFRPVWRTDWNRSLLLGRKIMYKCCYRYTVTDTSRRLRGGQITETFYCSTYFFRNMLSTFNVILFATLSEKGPEMRRLQPLWMHQVLWNWCNDSTDVRTNSMLLTMLSEFVLSTRWYPFIRDLMEKRREMSPFWLLSLHDENVTDIF